MLRYEERVVLRRKDLRCLGPCPAVTGDEISENGLGRGFWLVMVGRFGRRQLIWFPGLAVKFEMVCPRNEDYEAACCSSRLFGLAAQMILTATWGYEGLIVRGSECAVPARHAQLTCGLSFGVISVGLWFESRNHIFESRTC